MKLFTIGVYGTTRESFFGALEAAGVTHFFDVRRRRGVRGHLYTYANAGELQRELRTRGIEYRHLLELAPSEELRRPQMKVKESAGRDADLTPEFIAGYHRQTSNVDLSQLFADLPNGSAVVLFCVESEPAACHRSLAAERIASSYGCIWRDITPSGYIPNGYAAAEPD